MGPSPHRVVALLAIAFISVSLSGCSNSGSSGLSPSFNGKWTVMLDPGNTFPPHPEVDMNLTQTGGTLSSDANNTVDNLDCVAPQDPPNDSTSGSINGEQFMLAISIGNGTPNAQGVRLTGTVAKNHGAVTGSYESDPGPCFGGKTGIFIATFIAPVSDPFAGMMINNSNAATSNVTALLIEDANFNVSASLTVMSNTCFSSLASSPAHPGFSIGRLTDFEVSDAANTNVLDFTGTVDSFASTFTGLWYVTQGCTDQNGTVTLFAMPPPVTPPTDAVPAALLGEPISPLLARRFRALIAHRQDK